MMYVFLHGSPGNRNTWGDVPSLCPEGSSIEVLDLPDHGFGPPVETEDPLEVQARLGWQLRALPNHPFTLIGLSYGAYLAARIAAAEASDLTIARLVLIGGFASVNRQTAGAFDRLASAVASGQLGPAALKQIFVHRWHAETPLSRAAKSYIDELATSGDIVRTARQLRRLARLAESEFEVGTYSVPATVAHSTRDAAIGVDLGRDLAGRGTEVEWVAMDTACHLLPFSHAEQLAQLIYQPRSATFSGIAAAETRELPRCD